jgi:hypothetical protein
VEQRKKEMERRDVERNAYLEEQHRIKTMEGDQKRLEKEAKIAEARVREE